MKSHETVNYLLYLRSMKDESLVKHHRAVVSEMQSFIRDPSKSKTSLAEIGHRVELTELELLVRMNPVEPVDTEALCWTWKEAIKATEALAAEE